MCHLRQRQHAHSGLVDWEKRLPTPFPFKLRVVWQDGEADTLVEAKQARYGQKVIAELAAEGLAPKEIAARLNAIGILTMKSRPWREQTVAKAIERMERRGGDGADIAVDREAAN